MTATASGVIIRLAMSRVIPSGFVRLSAAVPTCRVAGFEANSAAILSLWREAHEQGSALVVFPELSLSGYTVRDLFLDQHLQEACLDALARLLAAGAAYAPLALVGLPLRVGAALYNVVVALQAGRVLAAVPKAYLPNYGEFEEARWFRSGLHLPRASEVEICGCQVPFGMDVLLQAEGLRDLTVGVEICEDGWVQLPPSAHQVSAGATVVCNPSASNLVIGKAELRRLIARSTSDRGKCAYVYAAAGPGESSTDLAFDADAFVCENGAELASSTRFARDPQLVTVDVDLERLVRERLAGSSFVSCAENAPQLFRRVPFRLTRPATMPLRRDVDPHPFLPKDPATLARRCWEIFEIQTHALRTRMEAAGVERLVLGLSGGLDSTHAALVCAAALDGAGLPRANLRCVTMPGLGTSVVTRENAQNLARALAAPLDQIDISEGTRLVLAALNHPALTGVSDVEGLLAHLRDQPERGDVALENAQARLRTLLLMTLANMENALVIGTGDLSEKALGFATYAGDQIAMYDVNAGVPKTLIRFVIRWVANEQAGRWSRGDGLELRRVLFEILNTPISPELLPAGSDGEIGQLTEREIGPYELHDFFLHQLVRLRARPARILDLARIAFAEHYALDDLKKWLSVFLRRFFRNQFKRSCTADGPKVGMVALSPRGDWRMPSDADVTSWLEEVARYGP